MRVIKRLKITHINKRYSKTKCYFRPSLVLKSAPIIKLNVLILPLFQPLKVHLYHMNVILFL